MCMPLCKTLCALFFPLNYIFISTLILYINAPIRVSPVSTSNQLNPQTCHDHHPNIHLDKTLPPFPSSSVCLLSIIYPPPPRFLSVHWPASLRADVERGSERPYGCTQVKVKRERENSPTAPLLQGSEQLNVQFSRVHRFRCPSDAYREPHKTVSHI